MFDTVIPCEMSVNGEKLSSKAPVSFNFETFHLDIPQELMDEITQKSKDMFVEVTYVYVGAKHLKRGYLKNLFGSWYLQEYNA